MININLEETSLNAFDCSGLSNLKYLYLDRTNAYEFPNITDCFSTLNTLNMQYNHGRLTTAGIDRALVFGSTLAPKVSNSVRIVNLNSSVHNNFFDLQKIKNIGDELKIQPTL